MHATPAQAPLDEPVMSQPARIVNAFIAPSKTFAGLHQKASWWMAWILLSIVAMGYLYTVDLKIGMEEIARIEMAKNTKQAEQMEKMPPEQRERALKTGATISRYMGYASPLISLLSMVIIGAVLMATFNLGLGTKVRFGVALAIVIYGSLPTIIQTLLACGSLLLGADPEGFSIRNPVASNPAVLVNALEHKFLYGILSAFDIFSLWCVALIGIGFAIQGKLKRSTGIGVVLGWFLLYKLVTAGMSAMF